MNKFQTITAIAAVLFSSVAFAGEVAGKLDSGLGLLDASYTGAEFRSELYIVGQSLDSGLGNLSSKYNGVEYIANELQFVGDSQDSGLGQLSASYTGAEFTRNELSIVGEKRDSGLGEVTREDITILMIMSSL